MVYDTEHFIKRAREVHGDKYDYSKTVYKTTKEKLCIICPEHGEFWQIPFNHLKGSGCPKCARKRIAKKNVHNTQDFIEKAKEVHKGKYTYDNVNYVNTKTPVSITCPIHGDFLQKPSIHLSNCGCPECAREKITFTKEEFVSKANKVHNNRYTYENTVYVNNHTSVKITCPEHGDFDQTPHSHLEGKGCPKCAIIKNTKAQTGTLEEFIKKARQIHGDKYDYSQVNYVLSNVKVKIICPIHGIFEQTPSMHIQGQECPKCGVEKSRKTRNRKNAPTFIERAKKIHGDKYDYSLTKYINSKQKVQIKCPIHGIFEQTPNQHLKSNGCPKCAIKKSVNTKNLKKVPTFIERAKKVHGDKYDYSLVKYLGANVNVQIRCPIHGIFEQTPSSHLHGVGCPECAKINKENMQKLKTENFIKRATKIHNGKYRYDLVKYINNTTPVKIFCPEHGEFEQIPRDHLTGRGCYLCGRKNSSLKQVKDKEWFLKQARKVHGDKYDYSQSNYVNAITKLKIICHEKDENGIEHGPFWQTPHHHTTSSKSTGCPKCAIIKNTKAQTGTLEEFIKKARQIHGDKYDYTQTNYISAITKAKIKCRTCGNIFEQRPCTHLRGVGCPKCGAKRRNSENRFNDFLKRILPHTKIIREYGNKEIFGRMRLDFYLPDYRIGLEYQGEQHFKPIKLFGGEIGFKKACKRDKDKYQRCNKHGIRLLYFTYAENEIPNDYFTKVYSNEEEIKKVILEHIKHQNSIKYTLDFMNKVGCFQPDDIKTMKQKSTL